MKIPFYKYQGTGNDFIIIDQFEDRYVQWNKDRIIRLCDRRFGIGADGLVLLEQCEETDFRMVYFNADGSGGTLCGNGARCAAACMNFLNRLDEKTTFIASDGIHEAVIVHADYVELKMADVPKIEVGKGFYLLDTGSPHYVSFVEDLSDLDIVQSGRAVRYSARFRREGVNVNFVEEEKDGLVVATYERGVEDETLSCGTGVTATALANAHRNGSGSGKTTIKTKGGELTVQYKAFNQGFTDIWLCGLAKQVFRGEVEL